MPHIYRPGAGAWCPAGRCAPADTDTQRPAPSPPPQVLLGTESYTGADLMMPDTRQPQTRSSAPNR